MPLAAAAPFIGAGLAGAGSAFSNTRGARTSTATPTVSPEYSPLQQQLLNMTMQRLGTGGLPAGVEEQGISGINNVYKNIQQSLANRLTGQGLGGSPVAGNAMAGAELQRGGDVSRWETSLPWLARQFQGQDLAQAMQLLNMGMGQTNVGAGSALGAGLGSMGSMLGYLSANGSFGGGGGAFPQPIDWGGVPYGGVPGAGAGSNMPEWPNTPPYRSTGRTS